MDIPILLGIVLIVWWCPFGHSHGNPRLGNGNATDLESLLEFKAAITGDPFNSFANWNRNKSFCTWRGVTCGVRRQRVVALSVGDSGLEGTISPFLGNLSFLHLLDLSNNTLRGTVPPELGRLFRLRELQLTMNGLEGHIPATLRGCRRLSMLVLSENRLSGSIPDELGFLPRLEILELSMNNLWGTIPSSFTNISTLAYLAAGGNNLVGVLPKAFGSLPNLEFLALWENRLSGHVPQEFGTKLANKLQMLNLWGNRLTGTIPTSLGNCSKLTLLALNNNQLGGVVPIELGKLPLLQRLDLQYNRLVSGSSTTLPFLSALTNCSRLEYLSLGYNSLGGMLPASIARLSPKLSMLSLPTNGIGGTIPPQIANLTNLTFLSLFDNLLTGSITAAFGRLQKLERLYLLHNRLEGSIPKEIGQLKRLGLLSLSHNLLSGRIPDSLGQLQQLRYLSLHHNRLSGKIPSTLGECQNLLLLDLSHNWLTGSVPPKVAGLPNLQLYLNLSFNSLQGSLPVEISKITMAQAIDVSTNRFTGIIPEALESCAELTYLNLSRNAFQGPIPTSLAKLQSLQYVDLSSNFLSGAVPQSLSKLTMLRYVDLSFNNLTGEISQGFFANRTITALFMNNPGLCGPHMYLLPACPRPKNHSLLKKVLVPIASVIAFIFCCYLVEFFWRRKFHRQGLDLSKAIAKKLGHPRISYEELVTATGGFDRANLIGVGNFGSVYKGILSNGTVVAAKVLNLQNEEAHKSFKRECRVLGKVRHRNLIKIITTCSNLNFKCLVLQFMPNGSLEKHLYPRLNSGDTCALNLSKRLDIAMDIARGVAYLHHDYFLQVVHCDLKPANVLLDDNMTAHVTDFGIARLIVADSTVLSTSTLALRGSVGYVAPEYGYGAPVSTNGDVYSFGIVLLEMLTRKRPIDDMFVNGLTLRKWVSTAFPTRILEVVDNTMLTNLVDERIHQDKIPTCLTQLIQLALLCTHEAPQERPRMKEVVGLLERIQGTLFGSVRASWLLSDISHLLVSQDNARAFESQSCSTS